MLPSMKDELSSEKLKGVKLWITVGPKEKFTASEVTKRYLIKNIFNTISVVLNILHFVVSLYNSFILAGGTKRLPGWRRKCDGFAWRGRRNKIWDQHQLSAGGIWNNGQQWYMLYFVKQFAWCFPLLPFNVGLFLSNSDVVVRNVYYKYLHPKEALVSDGVLNRFVP